jgi:hypothetical protein
MELAQQIALLEGKQEPATPEEERWLQFMGGARGPREDWEKKWITCNRCGAEILKTGFPSPTGKWIYLFVCKPCRQKGQESARKRATKPRADLDG